MKIGGSQHFRRSVVLAAACVLTLVLTACTGRGGGQLPPGGVFNGAASFGFSFSCEDTGGFNPPPGQLRIELSYTDHGTNPLGSSFGIHGIVDKISPLDESMVCSGPNPPKIPNQVTFLGRYYLTSSPPEGFPDKCAASKASTTPLCRFEVTVHDNDTDDTLSKGDDFQITLSSATVPTLSELDHVFYTRGGKLSSGNLTVD